MFARVLGLLFDRKRPEKRPGAMKVHCGQCDARFRISATVPYLDKWGRWWAFCPGCYNEVRI